MGSMASTVDSVTVAVGKNWPASQKGRHIETRKKRSDLTAVFDYHGVGHFQPPPNFARPKAIGKAIQHGFFLGQKLRRKQRDNIAGADPAEHRVSRVGLLQEILPAFIFLRHLHLAAAAFSGVDAAARGQIMKQMEFTTLKIPTLGLCRPA